MAEADAALSVPSDAQLPEVEEDEHSVTVAVRFTPASHASAWTFPGDATLDELVVRCDEAWPEYDWDHAKLMVSPLARPADPAALRALLKPLADGDLALSLLHGKTVRLLAQKRSDIRSLNAAVAAAAARRAAKARHRAVHKTNVTAQRDAKYTFHTLRPLPYLPDPDRSLALLRRLKEDPGVRAAMRRHRYSVGLLTEMDPAAHTAESHEGTTRILGLNRNRGEVIELRLRTDAADGYRDYNTIRKTLCHELAHNVHGPHDRNFWDLCHQIEREVAAASTGRTVGEASSGPVVEEEDEDEVADHGAWIGGEYVLGGGGGDGGGSGGGGDAAGGGGARPMDRREILARAAEARMRETERVNREARERSQRDAREGRSSNPPRQGGSGPGAS